MAVDPNAPAGLPPGVPPGPAAPVAPGAPPPPQAPLPTTNPDAMLAVLQALRDQDQATLAAQQDAALGTAVTQLLKQTPNQAGMDATTLGGAPPVPPSLPSGPNAPVDPSLAAGGSYGP